jgi:hypothetical protein
MDGQILAGMPVSAGSLQTDERAYHRSQMFENAPWKLIQIILLVALSF